MGETFAEIVTVGPLLLGIAVAAVAGLVSFLSPCVLPLVPGYLAYVTGMSAADLGAGDGPGGGRSGRDGSEPGADATAAPDVTVGPGSATGTGTTAAGGRGLRAAVATGPVTGSPRGRVLAGSLLFVAGFGAVFVTAGVVAASAGRLLLAHQRALEIAGGVLMLLFALALLGWLPGMSRELRLRRLPAAGLAGAPVFGAVFALSWTPCIGPTIGAVLALGASGGDPARASVLAAAYTLGLGAPFLAFGLGFRRVLDLVAVLRRRPTLVTRVGAGLLALVAVALLTGAWSELTFWLRLWIGATEVSV